MKCALGWPWLQLKALITLHAAVLLLASAGSQRALARPAPGVAQDVRSLETALDAAERSTAPMPEVLRAARAYDAACRRAWGANSIQASRCDVRLGDALGKTRNYGEAQTLLSGAIERLSAAGPSEAINLARARSIYGDALDDGDAMDTQEAAALAIQEPLLGDGDIDTLHTLYRLVVLRETQNRYAEAEEFLRRADAAAMRAGATGDDRVRLLTQRGWLAAISQGRYVDAARFLNQAWALADKVYQPDDARRSLVLSPLIGILRDLGQFDAAEATARRMLDIEERAFGSRDPRLATALSQLALTLPANRADEAEALLRRSLELTDENPDEGPDNVNAARALYRLSDYVYWRGARADAEDLANRALTILVKSQGPDDIGVAQHLVHLSDWRREDGDLAGAERLATRALEIDRAHLAPGHPYTTLAERNLGEAQLESHQYAQAEASFRQAADQSARVLGPHHPDVGAARAMLAAALLAQGRADEAWSEVPAAIEGLSAVPASQGDLGRYSGWRRGLAYSVDVAAVRGDAASRAVGFEAMQLASNTSVGAAAIRAAARIAPNEPEVAELAQRALSFAARIEALERQAVSAYARGDEAGVHAASEALVSERTQLDQAQRTLAQRYPQFAELSGRLTVTLEDLEARAGGVLRKGEAVMQLLQTPRRLYVMLVTADGDQLKTVALPRAQADATVAALRAGLRLEGAVTPSELPTYDLATAHDLYQRVIAPFHRELRKVNTLYVIPDGSLASLPFALLVARPARPRGDQFERYRRTRWLGDELALVTLPSPAVLVVARRKLHASSASENFLAFADPQLGGSEDVHTLTQFASLRGEDESGSPSTSTARAVCRMRSLPGTAREATALAVQLHAAPGSVFLGAEANERTLFALNSSGRLARQHIVLFATHGLVASGQPGMQEPALVLTPAKDCAPGSEAEDGLLTASEIATLRFDADWVVLSGCNTASAGGEGSGAPLSGLARAFLYGGARRLLVSHWSVDSDATADLIAVTFRNFSAGSDAGHALNEAMQEMRKSKGSLRYRSHPAFWAPFALVGDAMIATGAHTK